MLWHCSVHVLLRAAKLEGCISERCTDESVPIPTHVYSTTNCAEHSNDETGEKKDRSEEHNGEEFDGHRHGTLCEGFSGCVKQQVGEPSLPMSARRPSAIWLSIELMSTVHRVVMREVGVRSSHLRNGEL